MPKKFKGENSKATEAKARKAAVSHAAQEHKKKQEEDALWEDDDKSNARKAARKEDKEKKRLEQLERKKELARLAEEEAESLKAKPAVKQPSSKVTRAQLESRKKQIEAEEAAARAKDTSVVVLDEEPIQENLNVLQTDGEARTVEDAIAVLSTKDEKQDMHPEKRVKAAYAEFESVRLPQLKADNPNLRLSQLKQMLRKEWQKSPDNPLNARLLKN